MFWIRAVLFALAALLIFAAAPPARADVTPHEATGFRIVNDYDWLQAVNPKDGSVAWSRRVRNVAAGTILAAVPGAWVIVQNDSLEAFDPATGKALWKRRLDEGSALAWGPEVLAREGGAPTLGFAIRHDDGEKRTVTVEALDPVTGAQAWSRTLDQQLVEAAPWSGDLLLLLRPFTFRPPDLGYRRRQGEAEEKPAVEAPRQDTLLLLEGTSGEDLWSDSPRGQVQSGPWVLGSYALVMEKGDGETERFLTAREKNSARVAWANPLSRPLPFAPRFLAGSEDPQKRIVYLDGGKKGGRLVVAELERGQVFWDFELPADLAVEGDSLVDGKGQLYLLLKTADTERPATLVAALDLLTGQPAADLTLPGLATQALVQGPKLFLFLKEAAKEPELDPKGRPVVDLADGKPREKPVEGYSLVEIQEGEARVLAANPRSTLVGEAAVADGLLLYLTRTEPVQKEGEARKVDYRHPEAPRVLNAVDMATGRPKWTWDPSAGRLAGSGDLVDGVLYVPTEEDRLLALDPGTGEVRWTSPQTFKGGAGEVEALAEGGLFLVSGADRAFTLDPQTGAVLHSRSLVPIFNFVKLNNLLGVILLTGSIAWFIYHARRRDLFIRRIAGLNALDEAVGRSTEMGKPVLYVMGIADVDDIQTLASLSILGHVARKTAEYDTPIMVPNCRSVVMSMAQEVVKESYTAAGRPDAFIRDNVRYLTDEQFGYTAGVNGIMVRDKPAANFYMGTFYAESLILAETGNATGAIQIAGTAMAAQLPFFVAACDYTLIGEELYAASAYLSRDPLQVGSLKGQDAGKAVIMASIVAGTLAFGAGLLWVKELFATS